MVRPMEVSLVATEATASCFIEKTSFAAYADFSPKLIGPLGLEDPFGLLANPSLGNFSLLPIANLVRRDALFVSTLLAFQMLEW